MTDKKKFSNCRLYEIDREYRRYVFKKTGKKVDPKERKTKEEMIAFLEEGGFFRKKNSTN